MDRRRTQPPRRRPGRARPKPGAAPSRTAEKGGSSTGAGVRLQRVMADAGVASRRECEQMILDGRVEVNGSHVTTLPVFVAPSDRITVDGRNLDRPRAGRGAPKLVYVMLNKPDNTLGTTRDELAYAKGGRRTVADLVKHPSGARLFPVGRLGFHATGLMILTNDGDLAERLTHARYDVPKTYRVWIHGRVPGEIVEMLRRRIGRREAEQGGVRIVGADDERASPRAAGSGAPPANRHVDNRAGGSQERPTRRHESVGMTVLEIDARPGKTEPLEEMLITAGCRVKRVARTAIGPLRLIGVRPGDWRNLTHDEVRSLKEAARGTELPLGASGGKRTKPTHTERKLGVTGGGT